MLNASKLFPTSHYQIHTGLERTLRRVFYVVIQNAHTLKASLTRELEIIGDSHCLCVAMRMSARKF